MKPRFSFNFDGMASPELKALHEAAKVNLEAIATAINKAKSDWLDNCMRQVLPPDIYAIAKSNRGRDRMKVTRWISENKLKVKEYPDRTELECDDVVLSRFTYELTGKNLEVAIHGLTAKPEPSKDGP